MSPLRMIYLALAVWGAVHPMYFFVQWFAANGLNLASLIDAWQANAASRGLMWDLTISAIALTVFAVAEVSVRRNWIALLAVPATFAVGLSFGLPLYLFLRSRPVR